MANTRKRPQSKKLSAKERKKRKMVLRCIGIGLLMVLLCAVYGYLVRLPQLRIATVAYKGLEYIDHKNLDTQIEILLDTHRWVTPQDSIFRSHRKQIKALLSERFLMVKELEVTRKSYNEIVIIIKEKQPQAHAQSAEVMYDISSTGEILQVSDSKESDFIVWQPASGVRLVLGDQVVGQEIFTNTSQTVEKLIQFGFDVERVLIVNGLETVLVLRDGERIVIDQLHESDTIIETLKEITRYKEFRHESVSGTFAAPVEYVNLRYGSKIFYCYTGDECENNYQL